MFQNRLELVQQSDEHTDETDNDLTSLWTCREFDLFHNSDDEVDDSAATEFDFTPRKVNTLPTNELLMPTMLDLDELASRRSTRNMKFPYRYDPSAATSMCKSASVMFHIVCLAIVMSLGHSSVGSSIFSNVVYHTQLINQHFDGTLKYINPMAYSADTSDNDTYTFKEMPQQIDKNDHLFPRSNIPQVIK